MTKRALRNVIAYITLIYMLPFGYALWFWYQHGTTATKDMIDVLIKAVGLLTPIPAAWLAFCFQRRSSYLQQLRSIWSDAIEAVELAIQYTHSTTPTQKEFSEVYTKLSCVIEEIRGVFRNFGEKPLPAAVLKSRSVGDPEWQMSVKGATGIYPFESIKAIQECINGLGFDGKFTIVRATAVRTEIINHWKKLRLQLLREFDRDIPTFPDTPFLTK